MHLSTRMKVLKPRIKLCVKVCVKHGFASCFFSFENLSFFSSKDFQISQQKNIISNFFDFSGISGSLLLSNISFCSVLTKSSDMFLINLQNCIQPFSLFLICFLNISTTKLINIDSSSGNLENVKIYNFNWKYTSLNIFNSSSIQFQNLTFANSSSSNDSLYILVAQSSKVDLNCSEFSTLLNFSFYFYNSDISIQNSNFQNIVIGKNSKIFSFGTTLKLSMNSWSLISSKVFLSYSSLDLIIIDFNYFINCTIDTFISGTSVNSLIINNSIIENIQQVTAFIGSGATIYNFYFLNSSFVNILLTTSFVTLNMGNLYMNNCLFKYFLYTKTKSNNFMQFQSGTFYILHSRFERIEFAVFGNQIISLKSGDVNVSDSQFINNGWLYVVDIRTRNAIEFIDLFYIWSCQMVYFTNNIFFNTGSRSLFSGFIISTLHQNVFLINNCTFVVTNKTFGLSYHGVLLMDSPEVFVTNNYSIGKYIIFAIGCKY